MPTGVKLEKKVVESGKPDKYTYYAGNYVYEDSFLKFFNHPEGYVETTLITDKNGQHYSFGYVYQYKDHLGNIRLSYRNIAGSLKILEENNYYPFGLEHKGYNKDNILSTNPAQKIKYNGKELQDELGLNQYDFGARFYDPAVGRWFTPDAFAEKYLSTGPYNYALDNPIIYIDPDGNQVELCCNWEKIIDAFNISIGGSVGVGLKAKVTKHFSAGLGATIVDADYSISDDILKLKFLGLNGNLTIGKNILNVKGNVAASTLEIENFNNLFDGNLPDFKSFTFLGAEGKAKIYKAVDAKGKAWVIKKDANGNWEVLGSDGTISADGVFEKSDIAAEFKLGVKLKFGVDLGKLLEGILDSDTESEEGSDTSSSEDSEAKSAAFNTLISNLGSLQVGTYVWDGENWILK
jgi:RHS repeat-associated protein